MKRAALVTLAVGDAYLHYWKQYCEPNWTAYARRHGLDVVVFTHLLDRSERALRRSPAWQKCLILGNPDLQKYERVIWLDADILINWETAPLILDDVPLTQVGGVLSGAYIHDDLKPVYLQRSRGKPLATLNGQSKRDLWAQDQAAYYRHYQLEPTFGDIVQTGVLVLSPVHHRSMLEQVYAATYPVEHRSYEQVPLSHTILKDGLLHALDSRFNTIFWERAIVHYPYVMNGDAPQRADWIRLAIRTEMANSYFLHLAYDRHLARFLVA